MIAVAVDVRFWNADRAATIEMPDQAANALLPFHLGQWAVEAGNEPVYIAHTTRSSGARDLPGPVKWIPRRSSMNVTTLLKTDPS